MSESINQDETGAGNSVPANHCADRAPEASAEEAAPVEDTTTAQEPKKTPETPAGDQSVTGPTPEQQAELDAMVDYTVTEESLAELNAHLPEGAPELKVGDKVKLAKDHPLLTAAE